MAEQIKPTKTELSIPPVEVGVSAPKTGIDFSKLTDEQLGIAEKVIAEAEAQGLDPEIALKIAHIENKFTQGRNSPKGAIGVMQLMPGTAEMLKVDPNNIDQNIKGGITYYKQMLDKYKDPNIAAIAYNAGPGVADKFLESDDPSVIPTETLDYVEQLNNLYSPGTVQDAGADLTDDDIPEVVDFEVEKTPGQYDPDKLGLSIGAGVGAGVGLGFGASSDKKIAAAEKAEAATRRPAEAAAKKVARLEERINVKGPEQSNRIKIQSAISEDAAKEASRLSKEAAAAEKRLMKATDNARRFGVLEETVKTLPGGVTQEGGLGSGAMRHSNVMGEITEANVVRKGTAAAGPGYSQKSRLIVPDKYASAELYNPEQKTALAKYETAQKEHTRLLKAAEKAEAAAQKQAERLRNVAVRGPTGLTVAEQQLEAAKQAYADAVKGVKEPGKFTKAMRGISKIPGAFALPGVFAGLDAADAAERYNQGDIPGAIISGTGALGGALSMVPPVNPLFAGARLLGSGLSLAAPAVQYMRDSFNTEEEPVKFAKGGEVKKYGAGGKVVAILEEVAKAAKKVKPTVRNRERIAYPEIYRDPRIIIGESAARVSDESPLLKKLFGVDRYDLDAMTREMGHDLAAPYYMATRPPEYLRNLQGKANTQRVQDILAEAERNPRFTGSYGWYQSEPLRQRFIDLNPEGARDFERFTQIGAGLSPSTAVPKEIERGSVAYFMDKENRLSDFLNPRNMPKGYGHAYHTTAHNAAIKNILERGDFRPKDIKMAPKTRVYYESRLGSNLDVPTADAHFVRGIGLADLRPATKADDFGKSISATELDPVARWYKSDVSEPLGMRASPAQALQWNAMGTSTGVETELGVPFLELVARRMGQLAEKEGVKPTKVRDEFIRGKRHLARGGAVKGYAEGDYVDLGNSSRTMNSETRYERPNMSRPAWMENIDSDAPFRALKKLSGIAGTGLGYLKEGLNMIKPEHQEHMISIGGGFGLGDLIPGEEALKRYSKAGQGPFTGGDYFVNPVTGEGAVSPVEPDVMGMAGVAGLYGLGLTKPVTAPIKMLFEKYGPVMASKTARPYAMVEATSPELLQDTYRMRGTGEMAGDPAGLALTDERARVALERAGLSKYDVKPGQGAWGGGGESEFNRGYSIKLPRGDMKKAEGALAQFGSDTDQMMMSAVKFVPQKSFAKSTALEVKGVTEKDIVKLNKELGDKFVLQHRPQTNSVVVFNWETPGKNMSDLQDTVTSVVPKGRVTPGTYDSTVLDSSQYASKGAKPKGQKTIELEQKIINRKR